MILLAIGTYNSSEGRARINAEIIILDVGTYGSGKLRAPI